MRDAEDPLRSVVKSDRQVGAVTSAGVGAPWRKAAPLVLGPASTAEEALAEAVRNFLDHVIGNETCVLDRAHEEGVHQMRVAARRLRSRLGLFDALLPAPQRSHVDGELKWLITALGPARDWDVFLSEVLPAEADPAANDRDVALLRRLACRERDFGYRQARLAIESERYAALKSWIEDWVTERGWWQEEATGEERLGLLAPAIELASRMLSAQYRSVRERGERFEVLSAKERHKLRIQGKKARYAVEFFGSLYPKRPVAAFLDAVRDLQDGLGQANDLEVARKLMAGLIERAGDRKRLRLAFAAGVVIGCHDRRGNDARDVGDVWRAFCAAEPFWMGRT